MVSASSVWFPIRIEEGANVLEGRVQEIGAKQINVVLDGPLWIDARFSVCMVSPRPLPLDCVVLCTQWRRGMALSHEVPAGPGHTTVALLRKRPAGS